MDGFFFLFLFLSGARFVCPLRRARAIISIQQASKAERLRNLGQRGRNMLAKAGESDRAIRVKMVRPRVPVFLFFLSAVSCS
jgi:hypothetical protein